MLLKSLSENLIFTDLLGNSIEFVNSGKINNDERVFFKKLNNHSATLLFILKKDTPNFRGVLNAIKLYANNINKKLMTLENPQAHCVYLNKPKNHNEVKEFIKFINFCKA